MRRHANMVEVLKLMGEGWKLRRDESFSAGSWGWLELPGAYDEIGINFRTGRALLKNNLIRCTYRKWPISEWRLA